jgi:hypothetical protein
MDRIKYYLLSGIVMFSPLLGAGSGVGLFELENALRASFGRNNTYYYEADIDLNLLALVNDLAMCESSNREDVEIVDTNGRYSRGVMQFQMRTFETALKDLGYPVGDHETLRQQMLDGSYAKKIAYEWIEQDRSRVHHWSCYKIVV